MANPFADQGYKSGYIASLNARKSLAKTPDELNRINNEIRRIGGGGASSSPALASGNTNSISPAQRFKVKSFNAPAVNVLSTEDATKQAQTQLNPLYQQSRENIGAVNQQQSELLRARYNARGQLGNLGGGAAVLSTGMQKNLANVDTQYNTQVSSLAEQLRQRSEENARNMLNDAFSRWQAQQGLQMQADTANYGVERDMVADQRADEQFAYQKARDSIADEWQKKQFDEDVRRFGLQFAMQEAGLTGTYKGNSTLEKVNADRNYEINLGQLANSRANTGISAGHLALARQKYADDKAGIGSENELKGRIAAISTSLNQFSPEKALATLQENGRSLIGDIGLDAYNDLLKQYQSVVKNRQPAQNNSVWMTNGMY